MPSSHSKCITPPANTPSIQVADHEVQHFSQDYWKKKFDRLTAKVDGQGKEIISLRRALKRETELHKQSKKLSKGLGRVLRRRSVLRKTLNSIVCYTCAQSNGNSEFNVVIVSHCCKASTVSTGGYFGVILSCLLLFVEQ